MLVFENESSATTISFPTVALIIFQFRFRNNISPVSKGNLITNAYNGDKMSSFVCLLVTVSNVCH